MTIILLGIKFRVSSSTLTTSYNLQNTSCKQHTAYITKEAANFVAFINIHSMFPLLNFRGKNNDFDEQNTILFKQNIYQSIQFLFQEKPISGKRICN